MIETKSGTFCYEQKRDENGLYDAYCTKRPAHELEHEFMPGSWWDKILGKPVRYSDPVNHPQHYTSDPSGIECIEVTRHRNFNIGNAMKYLWRAGLKGTSTEVQDLEKAIWYIQDEIGRLTGVQTH